MLIALFILGILMIFGIARYNESNKLFWILFTAYILGFAGTKVIVDTFGKKGQSEKTLDQAYPTQGLNATSNTYMCFLADELQTTNVKETSKPVSQANMPEVIEYSNALYSVTGVNRGVYLHILPNPPNKSMFFNTS